MESKLENIDAIKGEVTFEDDSKVLINKVELIYDSEIIANIDFVRAMNKASFIFPIIEGLKSGIYQVKWSYTLYNIDSTMINEVIILNKFIDETMPLELQHLVA